MYDASSRKDVRRAEKLSRQHEVARIEYLQAAMSMPQGRAWFHDLLVFCHIFDDPFTGNSLHEAYRKGERNVGLRLFADIIAHCPDEYIQMMKEANARRVEQSVRNNRADDPASVGERSSSPDPRWDVEGREPDDADTGDSNYDF